MSITHLFQNTPNPFSNCTEFSFYAPKETHVEFLVLNHLGELVEVMISDEMEAGLHRIKYHTQNLPAGIYYYRLNSPTFRETKKMVILH